MTISYLAKYLWKKKWLIIIPTTLTIALAWFFTRKLNPDYTSVAELSTGYMDASMLDNTHSRNTKALFNNVIQTLQSTQVLDQVSYKLLFHDLSEKTPFHLVPDKQVFNMIMNEFPGGKQGLLNSLDQKIDSFYVLNLAIETDRKIRKLADLYGYSPDALMTKVQIQRVGESDFIKVISTTTDPQLSAFISNEICGRFLALYQSTQGTAATASIETLRSLVDTKKKILDNKLNLLQNASNQAADNPEQMLATLRNQLVQQKSDLISAQAALTNVNNLINKTDKSGGLADNEDIIALRSNMDRLYEKYVNGGLKDSNLLNQIEKLRTQLQQKLTDVGGATGGISMGDLQKQKMDLEIRVNVASQTISDLQDNISTLERSMKSSVAQEGLVQGIQSEIDVARQQYIEANNMYNQALNLNRFPGNNFQQVLHASPPIYPNPSKKIKVIGFAGAGIFFVLIFAVLFFEFLDPAIKTPSYLRANISYPLLATLRRIELKNPPVEEMFSVDGSLAPYKRGFRDQIKQLRYELEISDKKRFLIAGYHSGSGKTTIVESLAGSLSLKNRRVLLIDANFQNNTLSRKYQAEAVLESLVLDINNPSESKNIDSNAAYQSSKKIQLIGCGSGDYTPDEILPQRNIFSWLKENDQFYDYVLIDCAALNKGPDCKELLKYVEAVILVFAADQPLTEEEKKFMEFLKHHRVSTIGSVLNKVNSYSLDE